ncbi:helix-turn-helix domain-containing protein [Streptomyces indicus]|uniref:PucR C-terminal helix-turn-helix domain-containing protein n=1 Tax=Streptomyces indicus TaxID=417292 RepID=A0A1G8ZI95_9ACTN|nr:GAF domain-containing protein [Streptomyces indicus]SDK14733.1 PucR C-terminal helix-turn-helix domain-containing protein [Streptomyces indicus]
MASPGSAPEAELSAYRLRRERELNSLYTTARSLTALGEVDEVLRSIVRHAHELIGCDFAYLSLLDEEGHLIVRASAGTISPEFSSARLPPGLGLGGRVIESRAPYWVSNYRAAEALPHDSAFDLLVPREGLMALLGVPLLVGDEAIGALFAADRTERPFEKDEVALFSAFAGHAAVALNNARLYEQTRSSLERLKDAYRTIEDQVATMERAAAVHESLTHVVLTGGGPGDIAQLLVEHLEGTVTVLDRDDRIIAARSPGAPGAYAGAALDPALREEARTTGRCATARRADGAHVSVVAVGAGGGHFGFLALARGHAPDPADVRMLERSAQILGLLVLMRDARVEAEERVRGELLMELMSPAPLHPAQRDRALARGVDVDHLDTLVVAECPGRTASDVVRQLKPLSARWSGLAGEYLGRATMLLRAEDPDAAARALHQELRRALGAPSLVAADRITAAERARSFTLAQRCLKVMRALGDEDRGAGTRRYSMYALVFDPDRADDLDRFLDDELGTLLAYDRRRSTDLVATAAAYFAQAGNLSRTARALHVHLNTLLKRLDRIGTLLGEDWREPESALRLQVALRLHGLRAVVDGEAPGSAG